MNMYQEAVHCRQQAACFEGRPEEVLLLHLAQEFERLARLRSQHRSQVAVSADSAPWS